MDLQSYKNRPLKDIYINKLTSSFMLQNKYVINPEIHQGATLKIKFISPISPELETLIQQISFSCASCGGPDKARITIELGLYQQEDKWVFSDIKGCTIAYKSYTTPWRAIKSGMFTPDLKNWTSEVLELLFA